MPSASSTTPRPASAAIVPLRPGLRGAGGGSAAGAAGAGRPAGVARMSRNGSRASARRAPHGEAVALVGGQRRAARGAGLAVEPEDGLLVDRRERLGRSDACS